MKLINFLKHHPSTRPFWRYLGFPIGLGMYSYMKLLHMTLKVTVTGPSPPKEAVIFTKWHQNIPFFVMYNGTFHRALLTGNSPYMEPVILMIAMQGMKILRGGSKEHRNEHQSAIELMSEEIVQNKNSVVIAIDGPEGPIYEPKRGFLDLAKATGAKVVPMVYTCKHGKPSTLRWDRILWPRPFDHVLVQYGDPFQYDPHKSTEEQLVKYKEIMMKLDQDCRSKMKEMSSTSSST